MWAQSPLSGMQNVARNWAHKSCFGQVYERLRLGCSASLNGLSETDRQRLWTGVWARLASTLNPAVWIPVQDACRRLAATNVLRPSVGMPDCAWVAHYLYASERLDVRFAPKYEQQLRLWSQLLQHVFQVWPLRGLAVVVQRPMGLELEAMPTETNHVPLRWRLHSGRGPAITFEDLELFAWHGIIVPEQVARAPQLITRSKIRLQPDLNVRNVMIERYEGKELTWFDAEAFLLDRDLDSWSNPRYLWSSRTTIRGEHVVMLEVIDSSTGQVCLERIDPAAGRRVVDALAWQWGLKPSEYQDPVAES